MTADCLVLQTVVEKMQDLVNALALYVKQVLNGIHIILIPLEPESVLLVPHHVEDHLALLLRLEHISVQQIVNFLVIKLKEGDIDGQASITSSL